MPSKKQICFSFNPKEVVTMKKVSLGRTGIDVSILCLGTMNFVNDKESFPVLDCYAESGGSFFDTANIYGKTISGHYGGESELLLGRWMQSRKNRDKMFVATKVGVTYRVGEGLPPIERGVSRNQLINECDKSLQRLGVDYIDLYYIHNDFRIDPLEEVMDTLDSLIRQGKVRCIGASSHAAWRLEQARWICAHNGFAQFCCVQERYTYLRPKPGADFATTRYADREIQDWCKTHGVSLLAYSSLLKGAYTRDDRQIPEQYSGVDSQIRLKLLRETANDLGCTPGQLVLAWMMHSDPSFIPLITGSKVEQIKDNVGALEVKLNGEIMTKLNAASM